MKILHLELKNCQNCPYFDFTDDTYTFICLHDDATRTSLSRNIRATETLLSQIGEVPIKKSDKFAVLSRKYIEVCAENETVVYNYQIPSWCPLSNARSQ